MAQTALFDARFVSKNLKKIVVGKKPKKYSPKQPITIIPVGPRWAAVHWGRLIFTGRFAWWLREAADLVAFHDFEPWLMATKQFSTGFGTQEECPTCSNITR